MEWIGAEGVGCESPSSRRVDLRPISAGGLLGDRGLRSYLLKDGDEATRRSWVATAHRQKATGGNIDGKRLKVSHAIGRTARRSHYANLAGQQRSDQL